MYELPPLALSMPGRSSSRECLQSPGVMPMSCLKDFANAATDSYPCLGGNLA